MNALKQHLVFEWFSQELDGASSHGLHSHSRIPVRGNEDDGGVLRARPLADEVISRENIYKARG